MKVGDVLDAGIEITRTIKHVKLVEAEVPGTCVGCVFYEGHNLCAAINSYHLNCTVSTGQSLIFKEI